MYIPAPKEDKAYWKNLMIQEQYEEAMPWLQESLGLFESADARLSIAMVWS